MPSLDKQAARQDRAHLIQSLVPDGGGEERAVDALLLVGGRDEFVPLLEGELSFSLILDGIHLVDEHEHPAKRKARIPTATVVRAVQLKALLTYLPARRVKSSVFLLD